MENFTEQNNSVLDTEIKNSEFCFEPLQSIETIEDTKPLLVSKPIEKNRNNHVNDKSNQTQTNEGKKINTGERSKSVKRTNNTNLVTPKKRQKQTNIFNLMTSCKDVRKTKSKICPICRKDLEGQSNVDINSHIDNCIIK